MDVGHVLSNFPPIVENVFKYLSQRELDSCAQVCDLWKRVAETEKSHREDIVSIFQVLPCEHHKAFHSNFSRECSMLETTGNIESSLSKQLRELKIKPRFCVAFASRSVVDDFQQLFPSFCYPSSSQAKKLKQEDLVRKRAYIKAVIETTLGQYLPEKCRMTFCVASGIIGSFRAGCHLSPLEIEDGHGISGILIPTVPGLHIVNFPMDGKQCDISKLIPADLDIKCLLVFMTPYENTSYDKIIQSCLLKQNSNLALGGAFVERSESGCGSCVAFCGQGVEAASIVIKPKDKEAEIESKLRFFRETGLLKDKCFAFMFACVARGYYVYKRYNVESSIFHKLYPEVPLIGVFGNGEIGLDYLPNVPNNHQVMRIGKLVRCRKKYLHSYTTIFVLISLKL